MRNLRRTSESREVGEVGSVFKGDKNQLAPVEEVPVYVLSPPRTKSLPRHAANRDSHLSVPALK